MIRYFLTLAISLLLQKSLAQNGQNTLSFQALKTDLRNNAINTAFKYLPVLDSLFSQREIFGAGPKSLFQLSPHFDYQAGTKDAFSYGIVKLDGFWMFFKTTQIADKTTPDTSKPFHLIPVSAGFETNKTFTTVNAIAEAGYSYWYQQPGVKIPAWIKKTQFGLFLQGGYKFNPDPTQASISQGGSQDQSNEKSNSSIFRAKGNLKFDTKNLLKKNGFGFGFVGDSSLWYDFLNASVYYRLDGKARLYFNKDIYYDFTYEKGSGAPNFNQGDQYGMGLTVAF